ncbi:PAS domain S-box protein [Dyadobacter sp. CY261]|uniref:PAS domain S-box protein n=1 Tax=Dyadobacter sp. CY261 TaxID=2907203 RepID=UPI001F30F02F|nr:PAS domain S-box protein [Dyadobacter sp. CY261]MCF0069020.1 PAS domain S-box protein [Dyadobacter sp. CY261]
MITNTELYKSFLHSNAFYVTGIDLEGNYKYVNDHFCEFYGLDRDEIIGRSSLAGVVPEDIAKCLQVGEQCFVNPGTPNPVVLRKYSSRNGVKTTQWEFTGIADEYGVVTEIFCIGYDITQQLKVQEDLSVLVSNMQDVLFTISAGGIFTYVSPSWTSMYGHSVEETVGRSFTEFIHPDDFHVCFEALRITTETGVAVPGGVEHRIKHADGSWSWSNTSANIDPVSREIILTSHDITELRNSRERLKELAIVASNTTDYIVITDSKGDITWVNKAYEIHTGYNRKEVKGKAPVQLISGPETDRDTLDRILLHCKEKKMVREEVLCYTKTGKSYWVDLRITPVFDDYGNCTHFIAVERDITARKEADQELRRIKDIQEQTNSVARVGGWELYTRTGQLYWSSTTKEIHEVDPDYVPETETAINFYKEGADREMITQVLAEGLAHGTPWDNELQLVTAKGKELWVRTIGNAEIVDGVCVRLYGAFQDITHRKQAEVDIMNSEAKFRSLYDSTSDAVILFDHTGYLDCNGAALKMFGIDSVEMLLEMPMGELSGLNELNMEESKGDVNRHVKEVYEKGTHSFEWKYRRFGESKESFIAEVLLNLIKINDTQIIQAVIRDITIRKRAELDLLEAREHAEAASKLKSEFLANMSHEIRTPLNGVVGFTDLLMKTNLDETQQQYMSMVFQSANSLMDIINDILDFSKIEAGKLELTPEKTDLLEICSQVADMVTYQAQQKYLEMLLNIPADIPKVVWCDSVRLRQILVNLLSNAVKFTIKGEIELKIELLNKVSGLDYTFRFSVRDTGIGIDPQNQRRIFEAFSQEDSSTTKRFGGTGLGLTISNSLLGLMDSRLQLVSELEIGSTFFFDVRFKAVEGEDRFEWVNVEQIEKVLIVDDNAHNGQILKDMLGNKRIAADYIRSGEEAYELLLSGKQYDVLLIDCQMPGWDGIETIRKIRKLENSEPKQPVILLNDSFDEEALSVLGNELNISHFLVKPVKIRQLFHTLSDLGLKTGKPESRILPVAPKNQPTQMPETVEVKILIAEDHKINMLLVKSMLSKILPNSHLIEAANGKEAIAAFLQNLPDLVFMDIQMPEMNGYEATREIREAETRTHVPIIALTAGTVVGEREKCIEAGMDDYLTKPVLKDTLEAAVRKWLR